MKIVIAFFICSALIFASEFYSKIYPFDSFEVKSSVSGQIMKVDDSLEKSYVKKAMIIKIDDYVNRVELKESQDKLKNLEEVLKIQKNTYDSYKKVSSKAQIEKDAQKIQVLNTEASISDLKIRIATLKNSIENKNIVLNNKYLEIVLVQVGDYVNPGTTLYKAYDLSKGKLEVYLPINDIDLYKNKTIYFDGKKTSYKLDNISKIADSVHISSYKAEIIIPKPENFSKLVKIEFK
jgi:multidrug resistance efflux pump